MILLVKEHMLQKDVMIFMKHRGKAFSCKLPK